VPQALAIECEDISELQLEACGVDPEVVTDKQRAADVGLADIDPNHPLSAPVQQPLGEVPLVARKVESGRGRPCLG
jgi:hypothetical protein